MPAYKCLDDGGEGEIQFFADAAEAEKYWGEEENTPRAPEFDQYEQLGYVPAEAMIANNWYQYCDHCGRRSDCEEDDDHDGQQVEHVFRGQFYFCHPVCEQSWRSERDRVKADQDRFCEYLLGKYPSLKLKGIHGGGKNSLYASADFPGGKCSFSQAVGSEKVYLSTANMDAWKSFGGAIDD